MLDVSVSRVCVMSPTDKKCELIDQLTTEDKQACLYGCAVFV